MAASTGLAAPWLASIIGWSGKSGSSLVWSQNGRVLVLSGGITLVGGLGIDSGRVHNLPAKLEAVK